MDSKIMSDLIHDFFDKNPVTKLITNSKNNFGH